MKIGRYIGIRNLIPITMVMAVCSGNLFANDVSILAAEFHKISGNNWAVDVALLHDDTGWEHYADAWRIVDQDGTVLGERILLHPHEDEQPFVRGLPSVELPENSTIYIEAHDIVHGWTPVRLEVDLSMQQDGKLTVVAE